MEARSWQSRGDELFLRKLSKRDVRRYLFQRSTRAIHSVGSHDCQTCCAASTIATMHNTGPAYRFAQAIFADMSVAQEESIRTGDAVVVKCLNDRDAGIFAGIVDRRRE